MSSCFRSSGDPWFYRRSSSGLNCAKGESRFTIQTRFDAEVKDYLKIHKKAEAGLMKKATDSAETRPWQHLLADNTRPRAQTRNRYILPEISQVFKHLIATSLKEPKPRRFAACATLNLSKHSRRVNRHIPIAFLCNQRRPRS
jgi:hypothetical protein